MKKSRMIFIGLIFFVCICCISATAATEDTGNNISTTDDNNEISLEENEEPTLNAGNSQTKAKSKPKSFTELNNKINGNSDLDINLDCDYKYTKADSAFYRGIIIDRRVYINGNGHTIDGSHIARIFNITAEDVEIYNINFINGYIKNEGGVIGRGGAIVCHNSYSKIHDCNFTNNTAETEGGAIEWISGTDHVIYNCRFLNNNGTIHAGGMKLLVGHGHVVFNCTFIGNYARYGGGAFLELKNSILYNCTFIGNTAEFAAGLFCQGDGAFVCNSTFKNNRASDIAGGIYAIYGDGLVISNCILINNTGVNGMAAIGVVEHNITHEMNITRCYFLNNRGKNLIGAGNVNAFKLNVNNNIIFHNGPQIINITDEDEAMKVNANYNWFGSTESDYKNKPINDKYAICDNWLFLKASASKTTLHALNTATITLTLWFYDGENITTYNKAKLLPVKLTGTATKGKLNKKNIPITGKIVFTAVSGGTGIVKLEGRKIISFKIKKVNARLTAKAKTFYAGVKTKKYTVTLKNSKKTPIKNSRISLKVNGKKYSVKTNKKGIATFKIKNLYKKKKYKAVISYKGSSTYNKATKKVIIRCL